MPTTEVQTITRESMRKALEDIVGEYGRDHVYKPVPYDYEDEGAEGFCRYQVNGEPSCLFGHALSRLGVEYHPEWEHENVAVVLQEWLGVTDVTLTLACQKAQAAQDDRKPWGIALDLFITNVGGGAANPA